MSELELIERLRSIVEGGYPPKATGELPLGIGDDTSVLKPPSHGNQLFTVDTMVEKVHFQLDLEPPEDLGFKLTAINVSDIASMGGKPSYALVSLALPGNLSSDWFDSLATGLKQGADAFGLRIMGGDTTTSPAAVVLSMAMLGVVDEEGAVRRDGAGVGDVLVVTGDLGKGRAGREALSTGKGDQFPDEVAAYLRPKVRIDEGLHLAGPGTATAMIDISDGLASEAYHLARMGDVTIELNGPDIPLSPGVPAMARASGSAEIDYALYGGEDYELLATVPPDVVEDLTGELAAAGLASLTPVGRVTGKRAAVILIDRDGKRKPLRRLGYGHFGEHKINP